MTTEAENEEIERNRAYNKKYRDSNRERVNALARANRKKNIVTSLASKKRWRDKNKLKRDAQRIFNRHLKSGKSHRPEHCRDCSNPIRLHAHHEDYLKPLEVVWLCTKCHRRRHDTMRKLQDT